jgi:signal recognition particle receptor subunit beta
MEPDVAELPEAAADGMGMPMLASILLPLLIAVFFLFRGIGAGGGDKIVLFGPMGAGKTSMYLHLRFGHAIPSHTSMRVTTSTFTPQGGGNAAAYKPLTVVDVPGEPRLNYQLLAELPSAAVLVCVLDATALPTHAKEAAQVLYDVLTHEAVQRRSPALVIAANKSDERGAAPLDKVRATLETELQRVRLARTTMQDISGKSKSKGCLADPDGLAFTFKQLHSAVEVLATSTGDRPQLAHLLAALRRHC